MFVITFTVEPKPGTEQAEGSGGAYAVCWINFPLLDGAEHLAKFYIELGGWTPIEVKRVGIVDETTYDTGFEEDEKKRLKQYYAEAEADGVSIVFYEWLTDAEDAQDEEGDW